MPKEGYLIDMIKLDENIDNETLYMEGDIADIRKPFDPKKVDIVKQTMVVSNVVARLRENEIILDPDYQRNPNLWDAVKQSRLIESLIVRIPLPSFYFDYTENDEYIVVDGLQRLWTLKNFIVLDKDDKHKLCLKGLEYLKEYEGFMFENLPKNIQRRILEQELLAYVIRPGTPDNVKNSIFQRINTGGMVLTPAEIRNSVYRGKVAQLLKNCAESEAFVRATRAKISSSRMLDREFALRAIAFYHLGVDVYRGNLEEYFYDALENLKSADDKVLSDIYRSFVAAMNTSASLFGEHAFRKINKNGHYGQINKPLYECVTVLIAKLGETERVRLEKNAVKFLDEYEMLLRDHCFAEAITSGTARISNVNLRYQAMDKIIKRYTGND